MGITNLINASHAIALDTNIFILAYEKKSNLGDKARLLFQRVIEVKPQVFISVISFEEFFVRVYKAKLEKNLADYENFLTGAGLFTLVDVNKQIARRAAKIRADYSSIRAPDAIHLASAMEAGAKIFITTDKRLPRKIGKLTIKILS